jgi:type IV secretion system protein VirB6
MNACPDPAANLGVVHSVLGAVECHVRTYSQAGYEALSGPQSFFPTALTLLLTIYIGLLGLRLMLGLGSARLMDAPLIALKIGFVLALTLNWTTFQTLVFDMTMRAPLDVARVVAAPATRGGSELASSPLDGLQAAYDQIGLDATALGKAAGPNPQILQGGAAAAAEGLWKAQRTLFMSTVGLIAISMIAVGVLAAVGPVFIALFLFEQTRGLFAGWLRALLAAALTPMLCWITTVVMLVAAEPWLVQLAQQREAGWLEPESAVTLSAIVFIFAAAQAALALGAGAIAAGFQLSLPRSARRAERASSPATQTAPTPSRPERLALQLQQSSALRVARYSSSAGGATSGSAWNATVPPGAVGAGAAGPPGAGDRYRRAAVLDGLRSSRSGS